MKQGKKQEPKSCYQKEVAILSKHNIC